MTDDLLATLSLAVLSIGIVSVGVHISWPIGAGCLVVGALGFAYWGRG